MAIGTTFSISFDAKKVQRGLAGINSSVSNLGKRFASMGLKIGTAGIAAGFAAITAGLVAFTASSSAAAAEIESMKTSFTVLTGSAEKAANILEEIRKFGAETPLEQKDLQKSAQTLLAFGVSLEDVMPNLKMLGDISMGNAEKLGSLALVFGQVSSAGKLTGGDLLQFVNVGFNPLNEIAKRTGKSMAELRDMMSKGAITTAMVKQAFVDATSSGGMFNGMLAKMANTTEGKISNLKDNIASIKVAFGTGFNGGLRVAADAVNNFLPQIVERFKMIGEYLGNAIGDSVRGNYDKFMAIGDLIGTAINEGIGLAFEKARMGLGETFWKTLEDYNPIRAMTGSTEGKMSDYIRQGKEQVMSARRDEAVSAIRAAAQPVMQGNRGLVPGTGGAFQYAMPGQSSSFYDGNGNKVIQVLQDIRSNTKEGAKF